MSIYTRFRFFSLFVLLVFIFSITTPFAVYADDGTPAGDPPTAVPGNTQDAPAAVTTSDGNGGTTAPQGTEASNPTTDPSASPDPQATSDVTSSTPDNNGSTDTQTTAVTQDTEAPTNTSPTEDGTPQASPTTLANVTAAMPSGTTVGVIDAQGNSVPLSTPEAAQIINTGDPIWCPTGASPVAGSGGCSASYTDLASLVTALSGASQPAQNGTIWISAGADSSASPVTFDGTSLNVWKNYTLVLQGGWDLSSAGTLSGSTTFNTTLGITNWNNDITLDHVIVNTISSTDGITVQTQGNINLNNVSSTSTGGNGAVLDTCNYNGTACAGTGNVSVTTGNFNNNVGTGIYVDSGNNINLTGVTAQNNGFYGGDLVADNTTGNVQVTGSTFSNNADTGISVISRKDVHLTDTSATLNRTGALIQTQGNVTVDISSSASHFDNNLWTGMQIVNSGDVSLANITSSNNGVTGTYIDARGGSGNVTIGTSIFNGNGDLNLKAMTEAGNITLTSDTVDGTGLSNLGAWLKTFDGGSVTVSNSTFTNNKGVGLEVVSSGPVSLVGNTVTNNGSDGAEIFSTYTYACFGPKGINATVNGGTFTGNGGYGVYVAPGPQGTLTILSSPVFNTNVSGDYYLDLGDPCVSSPEPNPSPEPPHQPYDVVPLTTAPSPVITQDCLNTSGTLYKSDDKTSIKVGCPFTGESQAQLVDFDHLTHKIPTGPQFVSALSITLTKDGQPVTEITEGGVVKVTFQIPEGMDGKHFSILYWDPTANNGAGGWVELPLIQFGGVVFPLNPKDPTDAREILSGVQVKGNTVSVTVNFPGLFVLVAR